MHLSYKVEITIIVAALIWISFVAGSFLAHQSIYRVTKEHYRNNFIHILKRASIEIEPAIHRKLAFIDKTQLLDSADYRKYTEHLEKVQAANLNIKYFHTAIKKGAAISYVLNTDYESGLAGREYLTKPMIEAFRGVDAVEYRKTDGAFVGYVPLFDSSGKKVLGVLGGRLEFKPISVTQYASFEKLYLLFLLFSIPFSILMGTAVSGWVINPIKKLTTQAQKIGEGNYNVKVQINRSDEIGMLAKVLNTVQKKLSSFQKEMELKIKERSNSLSVLLREVVAVREKNKLAESLHDSLGQLFALLNMKLDICKQLIGRDNKKVECHIKEMKEITNKGGDITRDIVLNLSNTPPESMEVKSVLDKFLKYFTKNTDIFYTLNVAVEKTLPLKYKTAIYHIVTEAANNMGKHSHANSFNINIKQKANKLLLQISDDGVGFDYKDILQNLKALHKYGLLSIGSRVKELGGTFKIDSSPGAGCKMEIELPV